MCATSEMPDAQKRGSSAIPGMPLRAAMATLRDQFGRLDPEWGEVNRLRRGDVDLALDGASDTLRAIHGVPDADRGGLSAGFGDSYIMIVDWAADGTQLIRTIHQLGSATTDETSPHYADQAPLFAAKQWKTPPLTLERVLAVATSDVWVGRQP